MKEAGLAERSRDGLVTTGTADLMRGLGTCLGFSLLRANVPGRKIPSDLANALLVSIRNC